MGLNTPLCVCFRRHRLQIDQPPDPQPLHIYQGLDSTRQHSTYSVINQERVVIAGECSRLKLDPKPDPQPHHIYQGLDANRQHQTYSVINQERVASAGEGRPLKLLCRRCFWIFIYTCSNAYILIINHFGFIYHVFVIYTLIVYQLSTTKQTHRKLEWRWQTSRTCTTTLEDRWQRTRSFITIPSSDVMTKDHVTKPACCIHQHRAVTSWPCFAWHYKGNI